MMPNKTFLTLLVSVFILCLLPMAHAQKSGDISIEFGASQLSNVKSAFSAGYNQPTLTSNLPSTITATQTRNRVTTTTANSDSTAAARSMNGFKLGVNYYLFDNLALGYGHISYNNTSTIQFRSTKITRTTGTNITGGTPGTPRVPRSVAPVSPAAWTRYNNFTLPTFNARMITFNTNTATYNREKGPHDAWDLRSDAALARSVAPGGGGGATYLAWLVAPGNAEPPLTITTQPVRPILIQPQPTITPAVPATAGTPGIPTPITPTTTTITIPPTTGGTTGGTTTGGTTVTPGGPTTGRTPPPATGKFTVKTKFASHSFYSRLLLPLGLYAQAGVSLRDWTEKASGGLYKATWPATAINLGAGGQWMLTDGFSLNAGLNMHVGGKPKVEVDSAAVVQTGLDPAFFKKTIEDNLAKTSTLYEFTLGFGMTL